ncbi:MAG: glycosyltransferase [Chloroflexi bacterium]|nr:glycosyltransferase [Chloroflexota bacterium]
MSRLRMGALLALVQAVLGVRVAWRLLRPGRSAPIRPAPQAVVWVGSVGVVVPVLNEATRLGRCLDGLVTQGAEVGEILVVDSGSQDATCDLVRQYAHRDGRIRLIQAGPAREIGTAKSGDCITPSRRSTHTRGGC